MQGDTPTGKWRHKKTGGVYMVLTADAKIEATLERAVVYQSMKDSTIWVRPHKQFVDGRFERMGE